MSLHLSDDEIAQITGYRQASRQVRELARLKIPHFVNAAGRPIIKTADYESGRRTIAPQKWTPRIAA